MVKLLARLLVERNAARDNNAVAIPGCAASSSSATSGAASPKASAKVVAKTAAATGSASSKLRAFYGKKKASPEKCKRETKPKPRVLKMFAGLKRPASKREKQFQPEESLETIEDSDDAMELSDDDQSAEPLHLS